MYRVLILFSVYLRVLTVVTAQEPCPAGQFRSGEYCEMCPWGKFSEVSGATSAETCLFCEPGQYSDDPGGGAAWTRCLPCPWNSSSDPVLLSQNIVGGETDTRAQTQCACNVGYAQDEDYRNYDLMMMSFICSCRNKNEPTAIYPSLGTPPPGKKKEAHVMMLPPLP
jgi:hypothetical protein